MKKSLMLTVCIIIMVAIGTTVWAMEDRQTFHLENETIRVYLDGRKLVFDTAPQIVDGTTLVPVRSVFEAFGMKVNWSEEAQTVTAVGRDNTIVITIGSNYIDCNDEKLFINVPARMVGDRTVVPLRAVSESLGCRVKWIGDGNKVSIISSPDKVIGTATINQMRCLIDYQPIDFVNIGGYTYLKVTDLNQYGFDVTEENGNYHIIRNENKIPALVDEYKDKLVRDIYKTTEDIYPESRYCHSVMDFWSKPDYGKTFDIFNREKEVYADDVPVNCYNIEGEMYLQADELEKYGSVTWIDETFEGNGKTAFWETENNILNILISNEDLDMQRAGEIGTANFFEQKDCELYHYSGWGNEFFKDAHHINYGIWRYENGKKNGVGYYMCYYQDTPFHTIYEAGEYEDGKLKNGVHVSPDEKNCELVIVYEVKNFEKIRLYPIE